MLVWFKIEDEIQGRILILKIDRTI